MHCCRVLSLTNLYRNCYKTFKAPLYLRTFHKTNLYYKEESPDNKTLGNMASKYEIFEDKDAEIVLDIYEERLKYSQLLETEQQDELDRFAGLNLEHGKTGVFDIEDLVAVLKVENAENVFVATVPNDINYVNYICIVSGKSQKHMFAIAQFVRRVFKQKRHKTDTIPKLEGAASKDWMAIDLGNIALHIFSRKARQLYDLDMLWAVGSQFDNESNKKDALVDLLEKHTIYLSDLQPAS